MKKSSGLFIYILLILALVLAFLSLQDTSKIAKRNYSDLVKYIQQSKVKDMEIVQDKVLATIINEDDIEEKVEIYIPYIGILYQDVGEEIKEQILAGKLEIKTPPPPSAPWWINILSFTAVIVIFIALWLYFFQHPQGGGRKMMSFGRSKVKVNTDEKNKVIFDDVAGADEEKEELQEIVEFLKFPRKFMELGARIPKGVLLVGPPGTGKTLLAKAISGEAGVPFFSISGSDFVEMFVGVGASRVRDLFEQAKKSAPCLIFIDEIDAVGRHRGAGLGGGHDEREQTLNQLLVEMDGFGTNEGVIVIAATNRPDILDPALMRPGRFDRQVMVGIPDIKGREAILKVHAEGKPLGNDVDLASIAKGTIGFTGADLENLLNEAALLAARNNQTEIHVENIDLAILKVLMGPEKRTRVIRDTDKKVTAYHEAGHAIVMQLLPTQDPVHEISIIQRGQAAGYTLSRPTEDKQHRSKKEMIETIISLLGGRVAEKLVFDDITTGASNDISRATQIARNMVTKYGMSERLGPVVYGSGNDEVFIGRDFTHTRTFSEHVAAEIDEEIRNVIDDCYTKCTQLIEDNMDKLNTVANTLIEKEKISNEEFVKLFEGGLEETCDSGEGI